MTTAALGLVAGAIRERIDQTSIERQVGWHQQYVNQRLEAIVPAAIGYALEHPYESVYVNVIFHVIQTSTYDPELRRRMYDIPAVPQGDIKVGFDTQAHAGDHRQGQYDVMIFTRVNWFEFGTSVLLDDLLKQSSPDLYERYALERTRAMEEHLRTHPEQRSLRQIQKAPREDALNYRELRDESR